MKQCFKYALRYATVVVMMLSALTFTACGGDDDEGDGNQSGQVDKKNKNANILSAANGYNKAIRRTEFPALKKTGKQKVIVYRMTSTSYDKDGVNFSVEWDCDKRSQRWTCYQMHKGYSGKYSRESNFFFDQTNLNSNEYWGEYTYFPGYDRGHICPSGDRTASKEMNSQTFVMTNMQPQYHKFNGFDDSGNNGLWVRMENQLRKWADKLSATDTIFVCKGGTIDSETNIITRIGASSSCRSTSTWLSCARARSDMQAWRSGANRKMRGARTRRYVHTLSLSQNLRSAPASTSSATSLMMWRRRSRRRSTRVSGRAYNLSPPTDVL